MKINDLVFPVVSLSGDTMVAAQTAEELARGTRKAVNDGYFDDLVVVDSVGNRVALSSAKPLADRNPLVLLVWLVGFPVTLAFQSLEVLSPITLENFKQTVSNQLNRDRGFWNSVGEGFTGLQDGVKSASGFREVISLFV